MSDAGMEQIHDMHVHEGTNKLEAPEQPKTTVDGGDVAAAMHIDEGNNKLEAPEPPETTVHSSDSAESAAPAIVYKKGAWSKTEDEKLKRAVEKYGIEHWVAVERYSGLARQARNCRLRWLNYLKKGPFTQDEERGILYLHSKYGNKWARIASKVEQTMG